MSEVAHKRLLSRIALLVILSTTSIPLGLLQVGIWANMFDEFYEETQSIALSAEWALDGLHRCSGCELVEEIGSDSREAISQLNTFSFETKLVHDPGLKIIIPKIQFIGKNYFQIEDVYTRIDLIETPPPRA